MRLRRSPHFTADDKSAELNSNHRAIRSFMPDPPPGELIEKLVEASTKAPSGGN
jgi:nitroreductase